MKTTLTFSLLVLALLAFAGCSDVYYSNPDLMTSGVLADAVILSVSDTGITVNDDPVIRMQVRMQPKDGDAYVATIDRALISRLAVPQFQPGVALRVRVDPKDPSRVALNAAPGEGGSRSGNPYRDSFTPTALKAKLLPPPEQPKLYLGGHDPSADARTLVANNFAPLGYSLVLSGGDDPRQAMAQGQAIGATLVVLYGEHFDKAPGVTLTALPFPLGTAAAGIDGTIGRRHDSSRTATYWGKAQPPILGIGARALHADEQARLMRDTGIVIASVIQGSPAAAAGIQEGDVLVAIDSKAILDPAAVTAFLDTVAGKTVRLDLLRNGAPLTMTVQLNSAAP